jgi:homocysteine S-methyltransferase
VTDPLAPFLRTQRAMIVDGALATELERRGANLSDPLWSARMLIENPALIREVHTAYYRAGADVAITATYQASFDGFVRAGFSAVESVHLMRHAVQLATEARDEVWADASSRTGRQRPLVAASVGPYGASLADGSEYRGDYALDEPQLVDWHADRFDVLATSGAELLACETIPCASEVRALLRLLTRHPAARAWISVSARDGLHLSSGELFRDVVADVVQHAQVVAVGINCTAPQHVTSLIEEARRVSTLPVVVYPNSGDVWNAESRCWVPGTSRYEFLASAREWIAAGASLVGGCCGTSPADILALSSWVRSGA